MHRFAGSAERSVGMAKIYRLAFAVLTGKAEAADVGN
jgi:hypothetical protein